MDIKAIQDNLHDVINKGTVALHELYILGEAIKEDTTYEAVEKDTRLSQWEKDLIDLLIFLQPLFDYIVSRFAWLKSLIEWAKTIYDTFSKQGRIPA